MFKSLFEALLPNFAIQKFIITPRYLQFLAKAAWSCLSPALLMIYSRRLVTLWPINRLLFPFLNILVFFFSSGHSSCCCYSENCGQEKPKRSRGVCLASPEG